MGMHVDIHIDRRFITFVFGWIRDTMFFWIGFIFGFHFDFVRAPIGLLREEFCF